MEKDHIVQIEKPQLQIKGSESDQALILEGPGPWTIGRSSLDSVFAFDDSSMSRKHAVFQQIRPGKFCFIDLGSRNGSSVNGRRITTAVDLCDKDEIICGKTTLIFRQPGADSPPDSDEEVPTEVLYQRRLLTVLVVDIRGYTQLSREIDEELLGQVVGSWVREIGSLFSRSGCHTDKYMGDAAMGVWVYENQIPDHRQMCLVLKTLLSIQQVTANLQDRFQLPSPVRIGAGINTGLSVIRNNSGLLGTPDFSPLGDSVNVAFRLESATKDTGFDLAVGQLVFDCLGSVSRSHDYFERRLVALKGYQQPVEAWLISFPKLGEFLSEVALGETITGA